MWGIIPAAGRGSRIQPLAFSKELLPVGSRHEAGVERPRAVSEYLVERMVRAGAEKLCFVISPGKSDILEYYAGQIGGARICYLVQQHPAGLCDAIFQAVPFVAADSKYTATRPCASNPAGKRPGATVAATLLNDLFTAEYTSTAGSEGHISNTGRCGIASRPTSPHGGCHGPS